MEHEPLGDDMDCRTARQVWNHPEGIIAGLKTHLPLAMVELENQVEKFIHGEPDPFDTEVKRKSGVTSGYRLEHCDGESPLARAIHDVLGDLTARKALEGYFTAIHGQPIALGNICCSSHQVSTGKLSDAEQYAIQIAAVNTDPTDNA